ncbi:unnamed protein product [Owenia fusiformis]|uniref:Uncharacterized protein n=1 Tax=Owenia fusiformis TaxID=6347 RepID=A0A8J1T835_OWEFU|nr:unnamed protein product [Owenia fusiformis]
MPTTIENAYDVLELPSGADSSSVLTSYKRLALQWHPDKHQNSEKAKKKFRKISIAYKRLASEDFDSEDENDLTLGDMKDLFEDIFLQKTESHNGYDDVSSDDSEDETDYLTMFANKLKTKQDFRKNRSDENHHNGSRLTAEEIEKNADELLAEEEKEKRKAEKRRAKKKRRREKKRIEKSEETKGENTKNTNHKSKQNGLDRHKDKKSKGSSDSETEDFDQKSAFFKVVSKKKKGTTEVLPEIQPNVTTKKIKGKPQQKDTTEETEELDPLVLRSRQLAIRGNEMANEGHYQMAADLFSEAIKLDHSDYRFYGNRSYCFDRLLQYEKALKDADKAIALDSDWPKGFFRKGRALAGLKLYADAEQAFMQVIKLDRNCDDALQELLRVRTHQLTEMGFSRQQAESAIRQYNTVQQALDSLLAGVVAESNLGGEVYVSDEDDYTITHSNKPTVSTTTNHIATTQQFTTVYTQKTEKIPDTKMDPKNPEGLTALWVGNVLPEVKEKNLTQLFSKYGTVTSVRCLPEKYCAFINFKTKEGAGKAMNNLQGFECGGQRLLIKFPDNPIENGVPGTVPGSLVLKKSNITAPSPSHQQNQQAPKTQSIPGLPASLAAAAGVRNEPKQTGPVNGDECYFWRTTGCAYGDKCHYKHNPTSKGIDKKPWQKVK